MKILLTNDDGIYSKTLFELAKALSTDNEVYIMAPDAQRSACSHSMTLISPLIPKKCDMFPFAKAAYMLNGTTVDCVKIARFSGLIEDFDLVISGINLGPNLGTDILYSGTVGGALEGVILGKKGIAVSIDAYDPQHHCDIAKLTAKLITQLDLSLLPFDTGLNINFPDLPEGEIQGVVWAKAGISRYVDELKSSKHPHGYDYFWLHGQMDEQINNEDTDIDYVSKGYCVITPIQADLTNLGLLEELKSLEIKL